MSIQRLLLLLLLPFVSKETTCWCWESAAHRKIWLPVKAPNVTSLKMCCAVTGATCEQTQDVNTTHLATFAPCKVAHSHVA